MNSIKWKYIDSAAFKELVFLFLHLKIAQAFCEFVNKRSTGKIDGKTHYSLSRPRSMQERFPNGLYELYFNLLSTGQKWKCFKAGGIEIDQKLKLYLLLLKCE